MNTSLAELLLLRSQWEEAVRRFKFHDDSLYHGTINSLEWFKENGYSNNRLRKNYKQAVMLAEEILEKV
jgi:hypothetical protein